MKEGIWGIGLIIISLITFAVVGTMSNLTTTNQQDYEFMKSSVEAAMYDARDEIKYRRGICLCTKKTGSTGKPISFSDEKDYEIIDPNEESECDGKVKGVQKYSSGECRYLHGEWIVNSDIFTESLISRFGTVAKNQETYDITVQDVVEYPPKTSVRVTYYQYLFEAMGEGNAPINNQMDAIFEGKEINIAEPSGQATVRVGIKNCNFDYVAGTVKITNVSTGDSISVNVPNGSTTELTGKFKKVGSYILEYNGKKTPYNVDPNDAGNKDIVIYAWNTDLKDCPCTDPETPTETPTGTSTGTPTNPPSSGGNCKWHAHISGYKCSNSQGVIYHADTSSSYTLSNWSNGRPTLETKARQHATSHCPTGTRYQEITGFDGFMYWNVYYSDTQQIACTKKEAKSANSAISSCTSCNGKNCYARCTD